MVQYFTQSQDGTLSMPYLTEVHDVEGTAVARRSVACSDLQGGGVDATGLRENCTGISYCSFRVDFPSCCRQ